MYVSTSRSRSTISQGADTRLVAGLSRPTDLGDGDGTEREVTHFFGYLPTAEERYSLPPIPISLEASANIETNVPGIRMTPVPFVHVAD